MFKLLKTQRSFDDITFQPIIVLTIQMPLEAISAQSMKLSRDDLIKLLGENLLNCLTPDSSSE